MPDPLVRLETWKRPDLQNNLHLTKPLDPWEPQRPETKHLPSLLVRLGTWVNPDLRNPQEPLQPLQHPQETWEHLNLRQLVLLLMNTRLLSRMCQATGGLPSKRSWPPRSCMSWLHGDPQARQRIRKQLVQHRCQRIRQQLALLLPQ